MPDQSPTDWHAEAEKESSIARMIAEAGLTGGFRQSTYDDCLTRAAACRRLAEEEQRTTENERAE